MNSVAQETRDIIFALWQMHSRVADFHGNTQKLLKACEESAKRGAAGLVAPSFCLGGYAPRHIRLRRDFLSREQEAIEFLRRHLPQNFILVFAGFSEEGKQAKVLGATLDKDNIFTYQGLRARVLFLDDLSAEDAKISKRESIDLIIILGNAVYTQNVCEIKNSSVKLLAENHPLLYVNSAGAQNGLIFEGQSQLIFRGRNSQREADFSEKLILVKPFSAPEKKEVAAPVPEEEFWRQALVSGVRDFVRDAGFSRVHLGLSGGIDSALVASIAAQALGAENVTGILMSSRYSSEGSVKDSLQLAENLGIGTIGIGIEEMHQKAHEVLGKHFPVQGLCDENLQARLRGLFLMAYSNAKNSLLLNTGNKSELAVGYSTLYGDSCGVLAVIGDLWKTQVYRLSRYINEQAGKEIIPQAILTKAPSAELRPGQKDQDSLPEYAVLDTVLGCYLQKDYNEKKLLEQGYEKTEIERLIKLFHNSAYKRAQAAPVIRLSNTAFGFEEFNFEEKIKN